MKIAFIGTHGTGKSTLAHGLIYELKKQSYDVGFVSEMTEKCPFPINEGTTVKAQEWMLYGTYLEEITLAEKYDLLVCDRSVLDTYIYRYNKLGRDDVMEKFVKEKIKTYDLLINVPSTHGNLTKNKIRSIDSNWQREIERNFTIFLKLFEVPHLKYESLEQVVEKVKELKNCN